MPSYRLPDGTIPVLLSSDTVDGLRAEATSILGYLEERPSVSPDQVTDMLFRTRVARRQRALAMVRGRDELLEALRAVASGAEHRSVVAVDTPATARRIGFVFPGQGSQRPGMGKLFYELSEHYRRGVDDCAAIHLDRYGHSQPLHYLLGEESRFEDTVWEVQPALMFHMYGLATMWQAAGVAPAATIGHSQGELAAGAIARVMTLRDAVLAVTHRARLVEKVSPRGYSMAVLGMDRDDCEALLARHSGWAELSVINSPHILAIAGDCATIVDMVATANARGQFAKEIQVAYPAHTSIVAGVRADFETMLGTEMSAPTFQASDITCYGATLGVPITPDLTHQDYWYWNLRNRVRFDRAVIAAGTDGIDTYIEVAEHPVLQLALQENLSLVPRNATNAGRDVEVLGTSLRTADGLDVFSRNLAKIAVLDLNYDFDALRVVDPDEPVRLPLRDFPHTRMNPKKLWADPVEPPQPVAEDPTPKPQRLVEKWIPLAKRTMTAPRALALIDHTGECGALAAALVTAAERHGATATVLNRDGLAELAGAQHDSADYDTAVVLLPPLADTDGAGAVDDLAEFFADRAWLPAAAGLRTGGECWLLTVGGETVLESDPAPQLVHGSVSAGFRSVGVENPGVLFRHLDLAAGEDGSAAAARIVTALHTAGEPELALRAGKVFVKRLVPDTSPAPDSAPDLDHVLIVGGTGQLGLQFCAHFAASGAGRITLLSRSGETAAVTGKLKQIRGGGSDIDVLACDIGDADALNAVAASLTERPVTLLVHAAVNYVDADLTQITPQMVATAADSKIVGLDAVLATVPRTADCRIVLCSSFAATMGGRGQILYAVTNRMLDITARRLRQKGLDCVSLQWGLWQVVGPLDETGLAKVAGTGVVPMAPAEAMATGLTGHRGDAVIIAAQWLEVHDMMSTFGQGTVLSELLDAPEPRLAPAPTTVAPTPAAAPAAAEPAAAAGPANDDALATRMLAELHKVMGADGSDVIDSAVPLVALGLDSLQALDFRKRIKSELDRDLPVAAILGGASFDDVVLLMSEKKMSENTNKG